MAHDHAEYSCTCCARHRQPLREALAAVSRRDFMLGLGGAAVAGGLTATRPAGAQEASGPTTRPAIRPASELVVLPVLTYYTPQRQPQTSWRPWGGIQTEAQADEEVRRIEKELAGLARKDPAIRFLPVAKARRPEEGAELRRRPHDVTLVYAAGGPEQTLDVFAGPDQWTIWFLRHRSGPVSLYYEILHPRFMRKGSDRYVQPGIGVQDVVVDEYDDLAWRLRSLLALRRTLGQRIVAIGGAGGWGDGHRLAPPISREKWHLDIIDVPYPDVGRRIDGLKKDPAAVAEAKRQADAYLKRSNVKLVCDRRFVDNAFLLYRVFKDIMAEHRAAAMTIQHCMGTIMPLSETTACLPLSLINDEGLLAFCESDFVVIPAGILMHHITGLPVFLNDPTWPHHNMVTIAHCTAPSRMDGKHYEPVEIHTHFESDYGAAPKVAMKKGQITTNVIPDFAAKKWVGFIGKVLANPFHDICRSQTDISVEGDCDRLVQDMRGFHWMTVYGDCRREVGYAIGKLGIDWEDVSA